MDDPKDILIAGGGVAGMSAAIMLARTGRSVRLIEADPAWRALGAGMTLNGGTFRAFDQMGLLDDVLAGGASGGVGGLFLADGTVIPTGGPIASPFGPGIPAIGGIMRPVLHDILQRATRAAGVEVGLGRRLIGLRQDAEKVTAELDDGSNLSCDLLVGADGINSKIRALVFSEAPAPAFTGQGCWRAVLDRPPEITGSTLFLGRQKCGLNPVSAEQMYMFLTPTVKDNPWFPESKWVELLRAELEEFTAPLVRRISDGLNGASQIVYRPLEAGIVPNPWYRGRVLLIGDAAHTPTPHSAFGAGLGVEDAIVLAQELDVRDGLERALGRFMERRYERCRAVVDGSILMGELEQRSAGQEEMGRAMRGLGRVVIQPI